MFRTHKQAERLRRLAKLVIQEPSQEGSFSCLSPYSLWKRITATLEWIIVNHFDGAVNLGAV